MSGLADYDAVDPRIGTMTDLAGLAGALHARGMVLCTDMVLNHTAREHPWARQAAADDPFYRDFYLIYPDRGQPDAYEQTLPDIFPELAPGNFTHDAELGGWVWTTFRDFQWDLNYANPDVFRAILNTMLRLATQALTRRPPAPAATSWAIYVRCHDDVGWVVSDIDAAAAGPDGPAHRRLLSSGWTRSTRNGSSSEVPAALPFPASAGPAAVRPTLPIAFGFSLISPAAFALGAAGTVRLFIRTLPSTQSGLASSSWLSASAASGRSPGSTGRDGLCHRTCGIGQRIQAGH